MRRRAIRDRLTDAGKIEEARARQIRDALERKLAESRMPDTAELYRRQRRALVPAMGLPMGIDYAMDPSRDLLDPLPQFEMARAVHAAGPRRWLALADLGVLFVLSPMADLEESSAGALVHEASFGPRPRRRSWSRGSTRSAGRRPRSSPRTPASPRPTSGRDPGS